MSLKVIIFLAVTFVTVLEACDIVKSGLSAKEKQELVKIHNKLRSKIAQGQEKQAAGMPPAADMLEMEWDDRIEDSAQKWANRCKFQHNDPKVDGFRHIGQNLHRSWTTAETTTVSMADIIQILYDEIKYFDKSDVPRFRSIRRKGGVIGHFTQVIWSSSWKLGCGAVEFKEGGKLFYMLVCNYGPGGNVIDRPIYKSGKACSACPKNSSCGRNGLCSNIIQDVDTGHSDMIHDAQMDYYGIRLATCSSDKTVKIFDVRNGNQKLVSTLKGHDGPVWQVAWAHPMFGVLLASCSYDRKVIIWKETDGNWENIYEYTKHDSSVNSLSWAPHEFGLILACGSSDGSVSVLSSTGDGRWETKKIHNAHTIGCNAVSWAPVNAQLVFSSGSDYSNSNITAASSAQRFVTGGCDNLVKIWKYSDKDDTWVEEEKLEAHSNWVRDVAWAPSAHFGQSVIASCSQDKRVIIWTKTKETSWTPKVLNTFDDVVWHVSWSVTGNVLAVSGGDNKVTLWKAVNDHQWVRLDDVHRSQEDRKS